MKIVNDIDNNKVSFYINIIIYTWDHGIEKPFCGEKKIIILRRKPRQNDGRKGQNGGGKKIRDDVIFFLESSSFLLFTFRICGDLKKNLK